MDTEPIAKFVTVHAKIICKLSDDHPTALREILSRVSTIIEKFQKFALYFPTICIEFSNNLQQFTLNFEQFKFNFPTICIEFSSNLHWIFQLFTFNFVLNFPTIYIEFSNDLHSTYQQFILNFPAISIQFSNNLQSIFQQFKLNFPEIYIEFPAIFQQFRFNFPTISNNLHWICLLCKLKCAVETLISAPTFTILCRTDSKRKTAVWSYSGSFNSPINDNAKNIRDESDRRIWSRPIRQ